LTDIIAGVHPPGLATAATSTAASLQMEGVYRRVRWRLLPFLMLCYLVAFLDRNNIGFAKLAFTQDLSISEAGYGFAAGIFYIGYILCEIPSNVMLARIGARKTMMRILVLWGLTAAATAFVTTGTQFNVMRFLLGAAEGGFFPGVLFYLTYWVPSSQRARLTALFMLAIPVSGIVGSPISGSIMHVFDGVGSWKSWQWLFVIEGLPAFLLGVTAYFYLQDSPEDAQWLTPNEKAAIVHDLRAEQERKRSTSHHSFGAALRDGNFYLLTFMAFALFSASAGFFFWLPTILNTAGVGNVLQIGLVGSIPFIGAAIAQVAVGRHSDKVMERRWHTAGPALVAATGWILLAIGPSHPVYSVAMLTVVAIGCFGAMPAFWTIPSACLSGNAAAAGIALISSLGAFGGFVSPLIIGWIISRTGSMIYSQIYLAALMAVSAWILLFLIPRRATV
jgi:D-galactonate transporter